MKNHVVPPAELIAPPNLRAFLARNGEVHSFHGTPYLPIKGRAYVLNGYLWAERLWK